MIINTKDHYLVNFEHIYFGQKKNQILSNINFRINTNEFITLIGHNGAGKSTIAKLLLGLREPSAGKISFSNQLNISYLPQYLQFDEILPLTVNDFLNLPFALDKELLSSLSEKTKITSLKNQQMHTLSGGEKQRVLLTRAIARRPDLLILDEPIQNIDSEGQTELYQLLSWVKNNIKISIFLISHDLMIISNISDKIIHLKEGKIIFNGDSKEFSQQFLLCPAPSMHKIRDSQV
ncbi:metal ABC transporter ATP-binding protein [Bartonella sp. DGB1]|uniref:metal ABC transporter ATP-binding protein n=1 Tax=Bartonella sp. DGB1 TaxID=3239807 RepID=UPI0035260F20